MQWSRNGLGYPRVRLMGAAIAWRCARSMEQLGAIPTSLHHLITLLKLNLRPRYTPMWRKRERSIAPALLQLEDGLPTLAQDHGAPQDTLQQWMINTNRGWHH